MRADYSPLTEKNMALPTPSNTTCDIYRHGNAPPSPPDVAGVACYLRASFMRREETGEGDGADHRYSHEMLVDWAADIRDGMASFVVTGNPDTVYVPNRNGTPFVVRFVERKNRGLPSDHKRVYLDRGLPSWPTNYL
jgi:hypothetical protein